MMAKHELDYDVLVEAKKDDIDECYNTLKSHGWFDFVDDIVVISDNEHVVILIFTS